ncbi:porphobilinogen synthase [Cohnella panacarvi]|uniref:porphobilinogen synthase n=1 Tax=Cohnella panacarvi TaxID=400776 RepID=UPI00047B9484|nr:porphobilinogen synthase [Cohnella panacarvi]
MAYPIARHRRLRGSAALRSMVRETSLSVNDLIAPIFITEGEGVQHEIPSIPGVYHWSLDTLEKEIGEIAAAGIKSVLVFGVPSSKDAVGTSAFEDNGIVQRGIRRIKALRPDLIVIADTCLCQFTDHGHCGVVHQTDCGAEIDNDESLELLAKTAVSQAKAGADIIAPSNMMDGFVTAIRGALDHAGFANTPIMSYSVKFASAYYGPFREAAHSSPQFGDRKTYQMDPANAREAMREAQSDAEEGADFLMVKPGLAYLDIVRMLRDRYDLPIVIYNVSAEYSMVKAAAMQGWIDEKSIVLETLTGMKRAGAELIITYHAKDAARWLQES